MFAIVHLMQGRAKRASQTEKRQIPGKGTGR